jgi:hypothetical protein
MRFLIEGDLVIGTGTGDILGIEASDALAAVPLDRLRVLDGAVVDVSERTQWFVDDLGQLHVEDALGRQPIGCAVDAQLVRTNGVWSVRDAKEQLIAYARDRRWQCEVAGTAVGGVPVRTDRETRSALLEAQAAIALDPGWSTPWELANGATFLVNANTLPPIIAAVAAHRRSAFETYDTVKAAIEAGTITTRAAIDAAFAE